MSVIRVGSLLAVIIVACGLAAVLYVTYRGSSASRLAPIDYTDSYAGVPPAQCFGAETGFGGYDTSTTSIAYGMKRTDALMHGKEGIQHFHVLVTADKEMYTWTDETKTGLEFSIAQATAPSDNAELANIIDLPTLASQRCKPWWNADKSIFVVPSEVEFTKIDG